mgnify:CR=1 FL=1
MTQLLASILDADHARLGVNCQDTLAAGADGIHFDVLDNHFAPGLSIGPNTCKALRTFGIQAPIDIHLMTQRIASLIDPFVAAGASGLSFHLETDEPIQDLLDQLRSHGIQRGLAIDPATPTSQCLPWLDQIDYLLVMTVQPGKGGQGFLPAMFDKITTLKTMISAVEHPPAIVVDGGVRLDNIKAIVAHGADRCVVGSALFGASDLKTATWQFKQVLDTIK